MSGGVAASADARTLPRNFRPSVIEKYPFYTQFILFIPIDSLINFFLNHHFVLDEMGNRIDDLERNIADLVTQSGLEGPPK